MCAEGGAASTVGTARGMAATGSKRSSGLHRQPPLDGLDHRLADRHQALAKAHEAADAAGRAHRAQALLVGNGVEKQLARVQRLTSPAPLGTPLVGVDRHRQEAAEGLALQVLQCNALLPRLGVHRKPARLTVSQVELTRLVNVSCA